LVVKVRLETNFRSRIHVIKLHIRSIVIKDAKFFISWCAKEQPDVRYIVLFSQVYAEIGCLILIIVMWFLNYSDN